MKAMKAIYFFIILSVSIVAFSCKKDKDDPKPSPTKTEMISYKWKSTGAYLSSNGNFAMAQYDTIIVYSNGTGILRLHGDTPMTWNFSNSETNFNYSFDNGGSTVSQTYIVSKLDDSNLWLKEPSPGVYELRYIKIP